MLRKIHRVIRQNDHRSKFDEMDTHEVPKNLCETEYEHALCWLIARDEKQKSNTKEE